MNSDEFRKHAKELVDYIIDYLENLKHRPVLPDVKPGEIQEQLPAHAPRKPEKWANIMQDVEDIIMPGLTHWQHPRFHAYFPAGNSYPSILGDMLSDAIGCVGFSWAASPASTELEVTVMDWLARMLGLPPEFRHEQGTGGGVLQGSASECVLISLLVARHRAITELRAQLAEDERQVQDGMLASKLVAYCSKLAHSCVEKAGLVGLIRIRELDTDDDYSLRGDTLMKAIAEDRKQGLVPFYVCASLGTTALCSFDALDEIGVVCSREDTWLHVDAAYAGSAFICPEFRGFLRGVKFADSFNFNPNKWMLVNFDCSALWVRDKKALMTALTVDPVYLQHQHADRAIDFRHWGIPLSRRFRALKLWFVIRSYGVEGLQRYIREHCRLAKKFRNLVKTDARFEVVGKVHMGLVCFRLKGANVLTQSVLRAINVSGELYMVPAVASDLYFIRFCVCAQNASEADITHAWNIIAAIANDVIAASADTYDVIAKGIPDSDEEVVEQSQKLSMIAEQEDKRNEEKIPVIRVSSEDQNNADETEFLFDNNIPSLPTRSTYHGAERAVSLSTARRGMLVRQISQFKLNMPAAQTPDRRRHSGDIVRPKPTKPLNRSVSFRLSNLNL